MEQTTENLIAGWKSTFDQVTEEVRANFGALDIETLNLKPNPAKWSIAQHIEHLIIINSTYYPVINEVRNGSYKNPWQGKVGFLVRFFGRVILKSVQPANKRKTKTLPPWEPSKSDIEADIIERFVRHQEEFKAFIDSCSDLIEKNIVIPSPANKSIQYYLKTAMDIVATHEKRHLSHMTEVYDQISET